MAKHLFGEVGSFGTVALRLFFAAAVLMLFWRPSLRMDRRMWTVVLAYGAVLALMNLCFYSALARLPLGIAVTIEFLGPLAVALAGSRRWLDAFWAVLAGAGVVLLTEGGGELDPVGVLFALHRFHWTRVDTPESHMLSTGQSMTGHRHFSACRRACLRARLRARLRAHAGVDHARESPYRRCLRERPVATQRL